MGIKHLTVMLLGVINISNAAHCVFIVMLFGVININNAAHCVFIVNKKVISI